MLIYVDDTDYVFTSDCSLSITFTKCYKDGDNNKLNSAHSRDAHVNNYCTRRQGIERFLK